MNVLKRERESFQSKAIFSGVNVLLNGVFVLMFMQTSDLEQDDLDINHAAQRLR